MSKIYDRLTCCDLYDSDTDGLPDMFETAGMKLPTGKIISTKIDKPDSDDDGLLDGEEVTYTINNGYVKFKLVSDPYEEDSDGDGLDDIWDPRPQSVYNNGEHIDLTHDELGVLQICLVELGYLDMMDNPFGVNYGVLTQTAVNIYQLNHGFVLTEAIDSFTYATIANEYVNKTGLGQMQYHCIGADKYKPYFSETPIVKPTLSQKEVEAGVSVVLSDNSHIKATNKEIIEIYMIDYSIPITKMMLEVGSEIVLNRKNTNSEQLWLFYNQVKSGGPWDIKLADRWAEMLPSINRYTVNFPFVFWGHVINAENLGNITYGYWGALYEFSLELLLSGGDFAAGGKDSDEDKFYIELGYLLYQYI